MKRKAEELDISPISKMKKSVAVLSFKDKLNELYEEDIEEEELVMEKVRQNQNDTFKNPMDKLKNTTDYNSSKSSISSSSSNKSKTKITKNTQLKMPDLLSNFGQLFQNTKPNNQNGSKRKIQVEQYELFKNIPYDHSIYNNIEIKITLDMNQNLGANEIINKINNFFSNNPLVYYEYTHMGNNNNNNNYNFNSNNNGSNLNDNQFDFYYNKSLLNDRNKIEIIDTSYMEALPSVFFKFIEEKDQFFYINTKLISIYFFKHITSTLWNGCSEKLNEPGILISNFQQIWMKRLKEKKIKYEKIQKKIITNSKKVVYDNDPSTHLIYIKNYYLVLFFNSFLNEYYENNFEIYSPFAFESAKYKQSKVKLDYTMNSGKLDIMINIFGCIFHTGLEKILIYLKDNYDKFTMDFKHFNNTTQNYIINEKLSNCIKRIELKDKSYYITFNNE